MIRLNIFAALLFFILGLLLGINTTLTLHEVSVKARALEKDKAYYDSKTGTFTWSCNVTKYIETGIR